MREGQYRNPFFEEGVYSWNFSTFDGVVIANRLEENSIQSPRLDICRDVDALDIRQRSIHDSQPEFVVQAQGDVP
jgi:hypothetical protein